MISLDEAHKIFLNSHSSSEILKAHDIPIANIDKLNEKIRTSLEKSLNEVELTREDVLALTDISLDEVSLLMCVSNFLRDKYKGNLISFSKNFFIPLTQLCRDNCSEKKLCNPKVYLRLHLKDNHFQYLFPNLLLYFLFL